ncbi:hypothetical protein PHLCEN_2v11960 [Hermanssonia centrifuga]|uniref:Uncharacterized protein n=1 Tax=Hermanssonia centrifuga TaxID=98765 RepID=A0A2R6NIT3_9APHY|nr:hypothetical protein PHLCEN_2v11960 [Hermanssonia centrifuga]
MRKLREEVDTMIGQRPMTVQDVHKLPYLIAVLRETLRLAPTAPLRSITPLEDTIVGGKYAVAKDTTITCEIFMAHRDPKVWGEDADEFRPERMLDGKFEAMPNNAWQPFGYGMRGCIGRPFAWQEAQITLVLVMQRFDITLDDPSYELQIKQTLTIKPLHFYIHASPRKGAPKLLATPSSTLLQPRESSEPGEPVKRRSPVGSASKKPIYVLYGSNTGSSEAFAQRIAAGAASHGFRGTIGTMDSAMEHVPTDGPVIVVTASFEGQPADNAAHFVTWLTSLKGKELDNVAFGVFGCGNHDWVATYQRIPTLCDQLFAERGAKRIIERGEGDAGSGDFFESFDKWEAKLWATLTKEFGTSFDNSAGGIEVQTVDSGSGRAVALRQNDATLGTVVENRVLTSSGVPAKRHIEFDLPEGATYRTGDYLAILPVNPSRDVQRAMARFGLSPEQEVSLSSTGPTSLPVGRNISVFALLSGYVELSQPATTRDLHILSEAKNSEISAGVLKALASDYSANVLSKRLSLLDILEDNRDIELSFGQFLQILPSMRVRQYSISSSPLYNPQRVSLTISVLEAPAISGRSEPFLGVASTYLAGLRAGDKVTIAVRASNAAFHPPTDPTIPLVMFCAGSGLAPMRGFLQERAMQKLSGREVAKSLLFLGCRSPTQDYLYSDSDLKEWAELGVVELKPAFSRASEESLGCKYVQDRLWHDKSEIVDAYKAGGKFFTCGAGKMAVCVKERLLELFQEHANLDASGAAERFAAEITNGRFAMDIFE